MQFFTSVIKYSIRLCFAQLLNEFGRFCRELKAEKIALDINVLKFVC